VRFGTPPPKPNPKTKPFFFEKKNQNTFYHNRLALPHRAHQYPKVFASFFKKKRFRASEGSVATAHW
jgi:hypothetical protein